MWYNFNLLTEGRTIQIWGPSNWRFRIPFNGDRTTIRADDIMEGDARYSNPMAYYNQFHSNLVAREVIEDPTQQDYCSLRQNNHDNDDDDESRYAEETGVHFNEEPAQEEENEDEESDSQYQEAQDPNEATDSQNEDDDIRSPRHP